MTSRLSWSYALLHCFFSASSVVFFCPFCTGVFDFASTHCSNSGGSGTAASPPCCCDWPRTAISIHLSNWSCVIVESPTLATAPVGTLLPQPASPTRPRAATARVRSECVKARLMAKRRRRVANEKSIAAQRAPPAACAAASVFARLRRDLENRLRGGHNPPKALFGLVRKPHAHRLATRLVHGLGHALSQRLGAARVELDRRHRHPLCGEAHRARTRPPELD